MSIPTPPTDSKTNFESQYEQLLSAMKGGDLKTVDELLNDSKFSKKLYESDMELMHVLSVAVLSSPHEVVDRLLQEKSILPKLEGIENGMC